MTDKPQDLRFLADRKERPIQPSRFRVRGLTCPDCTHATRAVETALNSLPGVRAKVLYNQALAEITDVYGHTSTRLREAVSTRGYGLEPAEDREAGNGIAATSTRLHLAIIGSGSGGFAAAIQASQPTRPGLWMPWWTISKATIAFRVVPEGWAMSVLIWRLPVPREMRTAFGPLDGDHG